jgi:hypothetical protein
MATSAARSGAGFGLGLDRLQLQPLHVAARVASEERL